MSTPAPLSFPDALEEALNLQAHGATTEEIAAHFPEHAKELALVLHMPAQFSVELEQTIPQKDLLRTALNILPVTAHLVAPEESVAPKKPRRPSLFTLLTYWISDRMQLSKILIAALVAIFLIGGVVLYNQLHTASSVAPLSASITPVPKATAASANPSSLKSTSDADIIANHLLDQAVDNASSVEVAQPNDSNEAVTAQSNDQGFANLQ